MCHFHLVSFVAVTKLFWLISSVSQIQTFTQRIIGIAPTDSSAGKGTVQSSMEHQCRQWALLFLQNRWGREISMSISTDQIYTNRWRNWLILKLRNFTVTNLTPGQGIARSNSETYQLLQVSFTFSHVSPWNLPLYIVFNVSKKGFWLMVKNRHASFKRKMALRSLPLSLEWIIL